MSEISNHDFFSGDEVEALGSHMSNPGLSCKDIADKRGELLTDGEYWIAPRASRDSFVVYCDMTTDGGKTVITI